MLHRFTQLASQKQGQKLSNETWSWLENADTNNFKVLQTRTWVWDVALQISGVT